MLAVMAVVVAVCAVSSQVYAWDIYSNYSNNYSYPYSYQYLQPATISVSQNNLNIRAGQTSVLTAYTNWETPYVSNTSDSNVATAAISGNQVTVWARNPGSTTITLCVQNASACVSLYVTVQSNIQYNNYHNYNQYQYPSNQNYNKVYHRKNTASTYNYNRPVALSLSQSSVSVNVGQYSTVTIYGDTDTYYLVKPSSVVDLDVRGNTVTLRGINSGTGVVTLCSTRSNACATINVAVNAMYYPTYNQPYYNYNQTYSDYNYSNNYPYFYEQNYSY